ncbi:hypothetical protein JDV02_002103 [Purpureocillium takamizusanense]|uniref:Uncharacterized protein n=1 Tax=Purpureocillium takamizusanense TaxID=2060973 RepID=A0A9Q8Q828_9HYPO|nr:uncharacterized protein JDV02_002103 [Purpureocillium takamizusanense]UNI15579.1 hypothetical protein JDV02_002103 [Purpureocillium takamizusanense]
MVGPRELPTGNESGYAELVAITNMEGKLRIQPPSLRDHRRNRTMAPGALLDRTLYIAEKVGGGAGSEIFRGSSHDECTAWARLAFNISFLRGQPCFQTGAADRLSVTPWPRELGTAKQTERKARELLERLSGQDMRLSEEVDHWSEVMADLPRDGREEQLTILVMSEVAYMSGSFGIMLDGAPRSIMECEQLIDRLGFMRRAGGRRR